jgi:DnaJ-like protein
MSHTDCFRALGVASDASWEQVRQAYKDLVRVWHPDRFHSDPQLRDRAEQQLQRINEAYSALKNSEIFRGYQPEPAPQPPPPRPSAGPAVSVHPHRRRGLDRLLRDLQFSWPLRIAGLGLVCLTLLVLAGLFNALRVPSLDSVLLQASQPRPVVLMPSRFIDPLDGKLATADQLSAWARGEVSDLWKSIPKIGERPPERLARDVGPQKDDMVPRDPPRHRDTAAVAPVLPVNGTELLWTRRSGAGELSVSNETSHDALATLVQAHTTAPLRAIYIQAKSKVCMRNIAPGLYDLLAEVGEDWDPSHMRFRAGRQSLDRSGPFQCIDMTTAQGTSGCRYEVVLRTR